MEENCINVLDTCIIMKNPNLYGYEGKTVYVSLFVNDELDRHKSDQGIVGANVRCWYNNLKKRTFHEDGTFSVGAIKFREILKKELNAGKFEKADDFFIGEDLSELGEYVIHTHDYSLFERLRLSGKPVEWIDQTVKSKELRTGKVQVEVKFKTIGDFKNKGSIHWSDLTDSKPPEGNAMVEFCVSGVPHYTGRYRPSSNTVTKINNEGLYKGVQPRNLEQEYLACLLLDPDVQVITISGTAGTGKTFVTMAASMQMVTKGLYSEILLGKGTMPLNKWSYQGFTKGDTVKKLFSHMSNYVTTIKSILGKDALEKSFKKLEHTDKGTPTEVDKTEAFLNMLDKKFGIQMLDIASIKGSSVENSIIIIDEAQEFSNSDIRAIASRPSKGTKIIILGDPLQQGCDFVGSDRSGFVTLINEFAPYKQFAHIELSKCERSPVTKIVCDVFDRVAGLK